MVGSLDVCAGCRYPDRRPRRRLRVALIGLALLAAGTPARAQDAGPSDESPDPGAAASASASEDVARLVEDLARRLQRLEHQNAELAERNRSLVEELQTVRSRYDELSDRLERIEPPPTTVPSAPAPASHGTAAPPLPDPSIASSPDVATPVFPTPVAPSSPTAGPPPAPFSRFLVGDYDDDRGAFVLVRPRDEDRTPFELRFNPFTQARYSNFGRTAESWVDSTGTRRPIRNYESTEITRNFLEFSGFALDPRLQFTAIVFSSTALNDTVYLGWINYRFNDAIDLRVGNWIVPGTREWLESFRYTLGADRLMATTFFRPNISPGVWIQGEPIENVRYVAMVANSLNRFTQGVDRLGSSRAFGGTVWWEPRGDFGPGPSDIENHRVLSPRFGTSAAFSHEANQGISALETGNPEDTILRLSDGTPLFRSGALAPGVELVSADVQLWAIDAALKYRGFSLSGEYFLRWLTGFRTRGGDSPYASLFDHGGLLQGGYFVVPGRLELFARTSYVTGLFGGGHEYGGGVNWYPQGSREWRYTFEVLRIEGSPAQNLLTGYRAGESGMLYQLQWFTDF